MAGSHFKARRLTTKGTKDTKLNRKSAGQRPPLFRFRPLRAAGGWGRVPGLGTAVLLGAALLAAPGWGKAPVKEKVKHTLRLLSTSFKDGGMIPLKYASCGGGQDLSPELNWKGAPPKTKYFALVVEDPDASLMEFTHWVIFNIPAKLRNSMGDSYELTEGFPRDEATTEGIEQGMNDFKKIGYDGPCPPNGIHRYYFKLFALDGRVELPAGVTKFQLLKAIHKHTLAWTQIMGLYGK